jgi:hypothetical protein
VRLMYPPWNEHAGPDRDDREIEDCAAQNVTPRSRQGRAGSINRCGAAGAAGVLTSRTVKPLVRVDEHSARCVARSLIWRRLGRPDSDSQAGPRLRYSLSL